MAKEIVSQPVEEPEIKNNSKPKGEEKVIYRKEAPLKGAKEIRITDPYNLNRFRVPRSARGFKRVR